MKKVLFLCLGLLAIGLTTTGCSNDDENASIEGKWFFSQTGLSVGGQEALDPYVHTEGCEKDYWEFNTGGVLKEVSFNKDGSTCESDIVLGTYTKSDNNLLVSLNGQSNVYTIMTLNSSTLKIKVTLIDNGQPIDYVYVFRR